MHSIRRKLLGLMAALVCAAAAQADTQIIFLDFDSGTDDPFVYTPAQRDQVQNIMAAHYAQFDVMFTQTAPGGAFSTITFNAGGPGGLAEGIDFRNINKSDNAVVNAAGILGPGADPTDVIMASAIIGSHEAGHILGLRHGDSFGPPGTGLPSTGRPASDFYLPTYPGPADADETTDHIMASPAAVGSSLDDLLSPSWFSERSAVKLAIADNDPSVDEATAAAGFDFPLTPIDVPNTIEMGDNAGENFDVEAGVIIGTRDASGDDLFSFTAQEGDLFQIEMMSTVFDGDRPLTTFDTSVAVIDADSNTIPYYGGGAFNDDEFETLDSNLIDLVIPADGTYRVVATAYSSFAQGDYELYVQKFAIDDGPAVPLQIVNVEVPQRASRKGNIVDGDLSTRWSNNGDPGTGTFEVFLNEESHLSSFYIATRKQRAYSLLIEVDGSVVMTVNTAALASVAEQEFAFPPETYGQSIRVTNASGGRFVVHEFTPLGLAPEPPPLELVNAVVPNGTSRGPNLIDGRENSSWRNQGDASEAYFDVSVAGPRMLPVLNLLPTRNKSYVVEIYVDGVFQDQVLLDAEPTLVWRPIPLGVMGETIRVMAVGGDSGFRMHEVSIGTP